MARRAQLRDYRIESGRLAEFVAAWTAGVVPSRRLAESRSGFVVPVDVGMVPAIVDKSLGGDGGSA